MRVLRISAWEQREYKFRSRFQGNDINAKNDSLITLTCFSASRYILELGLKMLIKTVYNQIPIKLPFRCHQNSIMIIKNFHKFFFCTLYSVCALKTSSFGKWNRRRLYLNIFETSSCFFLLALTISENKRTHFHQTFPIYFRLKKNFFTHFR